ncbi:T cell receptor beta chain variable segment [Solea senegalensis]|nr:T cell receptor beta chain variable segment [Solea senegalensis]
MDFIKRGVSSLFLFLLWVKGLADGSDVTQTAIVWEKKGDNATMHCNHTKGGTYFQMYWYRQLPGEDMKQVAFTRADIDPDFGNFSVKKFAATKPDAHSGTFTVKNVEPGDKGWYFCAVSQPHSDTVN